MQMDKKDKNKGRDIYNLANKIFPICRSITGEGVRKTLEILKDYIGMESRYNIEIKEIPSETKVFDWTVPKEWNIREAYIEDEYHNRIVDFRDNNLHVVGYSVSVDKWVDLDELKKYIYTQKNQKNFIPYVTSYYNKRFGFCMSDNELSKICEGKYHMYIDSELRDGVLNYGEVIIPGKVQKEILFSTYICHPSMANDQCSGPALLSEIIKYVNGISSNHYTYRFLFVPETIGSLSYLAMDGHLEYMKKNTIAGFNIACVGDNLDYSIVESKYANTLADKALKNILKYHTNNNYSEYSFLERGSDERQYNSPGIDLPVVCFCRSKFGEYPEYHTSADDMSFVSDQGFQGSYEVITKLIDSMEHNFIYATTVVGEPQLGKRGLYPSISQKGIYQDILPLKNFLVYSDGTNDLFDISNIIGVSTIELIPIVELLLKKDVIKRLESE